MPRLIEIADPSSCSTVLPLEVGDILMVKASGAHLRGEKDGVAEILGAYVSAVLGTRGALITPMGAPNVVICRATRAGSIAIDFMTGDPYFKTQTVTLRLVVGA